MKKAEVIQFSRKPIPKLRRRLLEPMERISELLFGLIMVLTVTCSFSAAEAGHEDVRRMLLAALGCNLAWGIIDAVFYLMARFSEQGQGIRALQALRRTTDPKEAQIIIGDALPPLLAKTLTSLEFALIQQRLNRMPAPPARPRLTKDDWLGGFGVFLLVVLSTFPIVVPFLFTSDVRFALRASNGIALLMLFITGYAFGKYSGRRPLPTGLAMILVGSVLVGIAVAFGG